MHAQGFRTFVEIGPGAVLSRLVADTLEGRPALSTSYEKHGTGLRGFLLMLAELAAAGHSLDLTWLYADRAVVRTAASTGLAGWTVDGQLVRDRAGVPLSNGLRPDKAAALVEEMRQRAGSHLAGAEPPGHNELTPAHVTQTLGFLDRPGPGHASIDETVIEEGTDM